MISLEIPIFGPLPTGFDDLNVPQRLELNAEGSYPQGGLTPSLQTLGSVLPTQTPLRIMIRPRGVPPSSPPLSPSQHPPDFIYDALEFEEGMLRAILDLKESNLLDPSRGDGFVFGILKEVDGDPDEMGSRLAVDAERCKLLVEAARPFKCVFHRAFDQVLTYTGWEKALEDVVGCGFDGILTSGGPGRAVDHLDALQSVIRAASGRVEIIIGGGVRSGNIDDIVRGLELGNGPDSTSIWMHSSCINGDGGEIADEGEAVELATKLQ